MKAWVVAAVILSVLCGFGIGRATSAPRHPAPAVPILFCAFGPWSAPVLQQGQYVQFRKCLRADCQRQEFEVMREIQGYVR